MQTIAYWIIEKRAHSTRLKAHINQIAQVAIDLSVRRGKTSLTILKAEKRNLDSLNRPQHYWSKDLTITFDSDTHTTSQTDLGARLKQLRGKRGLSQTELAKFVGVTPSTISQVESYLIYPSLPALLKMAEILAVEVSSFFQEKAGALCLRFGKAPCPVAGKARSPEQKRYRLRAVGAGLNRGGVVR